MQIRLLFWIMVDWWLKVVDYLLNGEKYNDSKPREELLNSISADNFGRKVVSFYEKCMLDFDMKKKLTSILNLTLHTILLGSAER